MKWIWKYVRKYLLWLVIAIVSVISVSVINVVNAHFIKLMTDSALAEEWKQTLYVALTIIPVVLVGFLMEFIFKYATSLFSGRISKDMKKEIVDHVLQLPVEKLDGTHSGEFISRMTNDLNLIQQFFNQAFPKLLSQPFIFIGAFLYLLTVHWLLAIFSIILMPIVTLIVNKVSKHIETFSAEVQEHEGKANHMVRETITGMPIIKAFQLHQIYYEKYENEVNGIIEQRKHIAKRSFVMHCFTTFLITIPYLVIALFGGYLTLNTKMSTGDLLAFIILIQYISGAVSEIPYLFSQLRTSKAGFKRVHELFLYPREQPNKVTQITTSTIGNNGSTIRLKDVAFSYDGETNILEDISFNIKEGEVVALVGLSGAGKSTIFNILTGFYPFNNGDVYVRNLPLHEWDLVNLREQFAVVSQDIHLFPISIEDNILCGNLNATSEDVKVAAKASCAHEFIMNLPDGYQTMVGERGVTLSGGQRQRIAIARAFLKDAPILLLDEATSALDTRTELKVREATERVMKGRTCLMIAHRLSTIQHADRMMVLHDGSIMESGSHDQLMKQEGIYKDLFRQQLNTV